MENKVAKKAIETIDMLQLISVSNIKGFDLKPFLYRAIILKEKDFRDALKDYNFQEFKESQVYIHCSSDAIIPVWAYMLLASYLTDWDIPHIFAQNQEEAKALQSAHLAHLSKMYDLGYADISGPFGDVGDIRGITIYNVPNIEMADSLANADPMVKAGRLVIEVHPWWAAKGFSLR